MPRSKVIRMTIGGVERTLDPIDWTPSAKYTCTGKGPHCMERFSAGVVNCSACNISDGPSVNGKLIGDKVVEDAGASGLAASALHAGAMLGADMLYRLQHTETKRKSRARRGYEGFVTD